jgi:hypothetical protein
VQKINWRLILIYAIASYFTISAIKTSFTFFDPDVIKLFSFIPNTTSQDLEAKHQLSSRLLAFSDHQRWAFWLGLIIATSLSFWLTIKNQWALINPVIAFVIVILLLKLNIIRWITLPLILLKHYDDLLYPIVKGIFESVVVLFLFFSKKVTMFISKETAPTTAVYRAP